MPLLFALLFSTVSVVYLFLLARLLGYRQITELTVFDYINSITLGSIAGSLAIAEGWQEAGAAAVAMGVYTLFTLLLNALDRRFFHFRGLATGRPLVLLRGDTMYPEAFRRGRLNTDEFLMQCRCAGYFDPAALALAMLEVNGQLSFLPHPEQRPLTAKALTPPTEAAGAAAHHTGADRSAAVQESGGGAGEVYCIISDSQLRREELRLLGRNEAWLQGMLHRQGLKREEVFLAMAGRDGSFSAWRRGEMQK